MSRKEAHRFYEENGLQPLHRSGLPEVFIVVPEKVKKQFEQEI